MPRKTSQLNELKQIAKQHKGILYPKHVVEFARDPDTALHSAFEWRDGVAAEKYRLHQARHIINVSVEVINRNNKEIEVSAFVALADERYGQGGYRYMPTLMVSNEGRDRVLETALWELDAFRNKYKQLKKLAGVFAEIDKLK
jgi:hypothetical protein